MREIKTFLRRWAGAAVALAACLRFGASPLPAHADDVWQYSVRVGQDPLRRAYLWIPPGCKRVRGVILGVQNMLEQPMFEDDSIRAAARDEGLAIVWLSPSDDFEDKTNPYHVFNPGDQVVAGIAGILAALGRESGYPELANAPLFITAHSAATPFVYGMAATEPDRVAAIFPYKGWIQPMTAGIPTFYTTSEIAEVGAEKWGECWRKDIGSAMLQRNRGENFLVGEFCEIGNGHFEWNPAVGPVLAMFLRKAAAARIPADEPLTGPVKLNPIDPKSGWLIDPDKLGTPDGKPVPYAAWTGDPTKALWYFDEELARTVNDYMTVRLAKKPQVIDFVQDGQPCSLAKGGIAELHPTFLADGATFQVAAASLDTAPAQIYGGAAVGHAAGPITFKASSGAIKQVGPDTFKIWMRRGGLIQQSAPWEPHIMAVQAGDDQYRRADRPGHPWIYTINRAGKPQFLDFDRIGDQKAGTKQITLSATSDAGLPVQFYVISGPATLDDDNRTLEFTPIPPKSKFPVRVIVAAFQWGRAADPKVQTAGPITQEFFLTK